MDLVRVSMPSLTYVHSHMRVDGNPMLKSLEISSLASLNNADWGGTYCTPSGSQEELCMYNNDALTRTETSLTYADTELYADSCVVFTDSDYFCFTDGSTSASKICEGDLTPFMGDPQVYVCAGATLMNASFIEAVDGDVTVVETGLAMVDLSLIHI